MNYDYNLLGNIYPHRVPQNAEDAATLQEQIDDTNLKLSIEKAVRALREDIERGRVSSSLASAITLSQVSTQLLDAFETLVNHKAAGRVSSHNSTPVAAFMAMPAETYVALGLTTAVDLLGEAITRSERITVAKLASQIGHAVSTWIVARGVDRAEKAALERLAKAANNRGTAFRDRLSTISEHLKHRGYHGLEADERNGVGLALVANMIAAGILTTYFPPRKGVKHPPQCVLLSPEIVDSLTLAAERIGTHRPASRPRLVQPFTLTSSSSRYSNNPGYQHFRFLQSSKAFCGNPTLLESQAPTFFKAANSLQATGFKINERVLDVILASHASGGRAFDALKTSAPRQPEDDYNSLSVDADEEDVEAEREHRANLWNAHVADKKRFRAVRGIVQTAVEYRLQPRIYLPVYHDFRGRLYYRSDLSPTGGDLSRGLLEFADKAPLGPEGAQSISIHLSATYGDDKLPMSDRKTWAFERSAEILEVAEDPLSNTWWVNADEPFQFLAACFEWQGYIEHGEAYESGLMVSVDATCSGLQHLSAIRRDPLTASAVNLRPGPRQDVYTEVGLKMVQRLKDVANNDFRGLSVDKMKSKKTDPQEKAEDIAEKRRQITAVVNSLLAVFEGEPGLIRKVAKQPVMSICYGVTIEGIKAHMLDVLRDHLNHEIGSGSGDVITARMLAEIVAEAARETLPGAMETLDYLREFAGTLAKQNEPFEFITPTGFLLHQEYRKPTTDSQRYAATCGGLTLRVRFALGYRAEHDVRASKNGAVANFVHSLDASHLAMTVAAFEHPIATVHDAFHCRPCDLPELQHVLREQFAEMYADRDILNELAEQAQVIQEMPRAELPATPELGDWDVSEVTDAVYCFS